VEELASNGIRSPDRPALSDSLYRLRYPGPKYFYSLLCLQYLKFNIMKIEISRLNDISLVSSQKFIKSVFEHRVFTKHQNKIAPYSLLLISNVLRTVQAVPILLVHAL
jgi:hypothetical protein